ncbi:hypothetical protein STRIP9103_00212 [Streptomyces ipomoeae 91-03]|uniref:Major facilitator superfamily (MFS) profile domain-containing protein n=1 Tax=Streptomyces ipomoeae 91-03 TaxID=698759 RepID=L1KPE5_9ACTN|nr:hypothetical protein STRIP9103_00212 [Streptomyces ipomoeae 91-03]
MIGAGVFTKAGISPETRMPTAFGLCALGFAVVWLAPDPLVLTIGAVINCLGGGIMLPSLLTLAMSKLDYADRGRGTGLWTGSFVLYCREVTIFQRPWNRHALSPRAPPTT